MTAIKYLVVHIVSSKSFKVSTEQSRRSFYRAANAIFGRIADVQLKTFCICCKPILLYGFEACPLRKTEYLNSLDFELSGFL